MDKLNYIFKTFSRTKRKDNENYVINAIWNRIINLGIKPITQQHVYFKGKSFYLDLYFPNIQIAIEIDEKGHKYKGKIDEVRSDSIIFALNESQYKNVEIIRIKTYETTIEKLHEEINNVANRIENKFKSIGQQWLTPQEEIENLRKKDKLSIYDNISFLTQAIIINDLLKLNKKRGSLRSGSYYLNYENHWIWFPKRSIKKNNKELSYEGWVNRLSEDRKKIIEINVNSNNKHYLLKDNKVRIVFMKYKDNLGDSSYRFLGQFRESGYEMVNLNGKIIYAKIYSLFNNEIKLSNYS